tara:strand:- start:1180 stop:1935 length:756 start_codon:yes stop_codon:yes gene_type:complete
MINNKNKVAIVTGGNKGIGLGITKKLINSGYFVIIGGKTKLSHLNKSNKCEFIQGDVSNPEFHHLLVSKALEKNDYINLYVNNAGFSEWRPIENISEEFLNRIFSVNLYGAFWGCKAASPHMVNSSSIVNISSIAGKRGSTNNSAYVATKFGMNGLTQSLAKELGPRGIRVNAICPVLVKTDGLIEALAQKSAPGSNDSLNFIDQFKTSNSALNRLPEVDDIAEMVLFLASSSAQAITGQCINVDCGVFPQ